MARAKRILIVPHLVKAGLVVGGKYGHGVAVCRTNSGDHSEWSAPALITVRGGTLGAQIGAEDVDLVLMVMDDKGLQQLLSSKIEMSLEGSVAAGPVGRHVSVQSDPTLDAEMLTYSRTKGVFAGQTLEGAAINQDENATKAIYGSDVSFKNILLGEVHPPAPAAPFLRAVAEISRHAAAQQARQQMPQNNK